MVQRYIEGGYGASEMEEDAQGEWVSYEDYEFLERTGLFLDIKSLESIKHALTQRSNELQDLAFRASQQSRRECYFLERKQYTDLIEIVDVAIRGLNND